MSISCNFSHLSFVLHARALKELLIFMFQQPKTPIEEIAIDES